MTNGEKFKTADDRQKAFCKFCSRGLCAECQIFREFGKITNCKFIWLELEYKEELKPCPFCGRKVKIYEAYACGDVRYGVSCENDICIVRPSSVIVCQKKADAIAAWNGRV